MDGMHQWYFADDFSPYDAAMLVVGHNPASSNQIGSGMVREIIARMRRDFENACGSYTFDVKGFYPFSTDEGKASRKAELISIGLDRQLDVELVWPTPSGELSGIVKWVNSEDGAFEQQTFSRREMRRWLTENRLPHVFDFAEPCEDLITAPVERTPVGAIMNVLEKQVTGKSETAYLGIIGALCDLYWKNKFPNDDKIMIAELLRALEAYEGFTGLSDRNLKDKLPKAIKIIRSE